MPAVIATFSVREMVRDILQRHLPAEAAAKPEKEKRVEEAEKRRSLLVPALGALALAKLMKSEDTKELEDGREGMDRYPIDQGDLGSNNEEWGI